jgi:hypothetical protein
MGGCRLMKDSKKVTDLNNDEYINELAYVIKMEKFYYTRKQELLKDAERRAEDD